MEERLFEGEEKGDREQNWVIATRSSKRWKYSAVLSYLDPYVSPQETSGNIDPRNWDEQTAGYKPQETTEAAAGLSEESVLTNVPTH